MIEISGENIFLIYLLPVRVDYFFLNTIYLFIWLHQVFIAACGILVPWPGIEPVAPSVKMQSPNYWTTRKFP